MTDTLHARAFDLPGWPTPPRVRDIPNHVGAWGYVPVSAGKPSGLLPSGVYQDEIGRLWADGDFAPSYYVNNDGYGAYLYWTERGLGLYVGPNSYPHLGNISSLNMEPDRWLPVAVVAQELPEFAKKS